jgi:hypothetical protein
VLAVEGVTKRGIWRGIYHEVFLVDTNLGLAYLYPPSADRRARIVLQNEGSTSPGQKVKVTPGIMKNINALMPEFEALCRAR